MLESAANRQNRHGQTPLHLATALWQQDFVELLIQSGANPYIKNSKGFTAFDIAAKRGFSDIGHALAKTNYHNTEQNISTKGSEKTKEITISKHALERILKLPKEVIIETEKQVKKWLDEGILEYK